MKTVSLWTLLDFWRTRAYLLREGSYVEQIAVLKPTRKERMKLPAIRPLKAQRAHVLSCAAEFQKKRVGRA